MTAIAIALIFGLSLVGWYFPPAAVFVYSMASPLGDGFGIAGFLRANGYALYVSLISIPLLISAGASYYRIRRRYRRGLVTKRAARLATALMLVAGWIAMSVLWKTGSPALVPNQIAYSGFLAGIVVIAYYRSRNAKRLFVLALTIQLLVSAGIVLMPDSALSAVRATRYLSDDAFFYEPERYTGGVTRLESDLRFSAQHSNPLAYGVYASAGIAVGAALVLARRAAPVRITGLVLLGAAVFGWVLTFSRGTTLGLIAGIVLHWFRAATSRRNSLHRFKVGATAAAFMIGLMVAPIPWADISRLFSITEPDGGVATRFIALQQAWTIVRESPLVGAPVGFEWIGNIAPHQLPIWFAAQYGVPTGVVVLLLFIATGVSFSMPRPDRRHIHFGLAIVLGWVALGTGITNNFSSPILFWVCLVYGALPWLVATAPQIAPENAPVRRSGEPGSDEAGPLPSPGGALAVQGSGTT
jgi:hypothetical protein